MHAMLCGSAAFLTVIVSFADAARAQTIIVSPRGLANTEGSSNSVFPWMDPTPRRFLQIHSDLKGFAMTIKSLMFRKEGSLAPATGTRAINLELFMASSVDWDKASFVFGNNRTGPATSVVKSTINFGPLLGSGSPSPFEMVIPLSTLYVYPGFDSLLWEVHVQSNTLLGSFPAACDLDLVTNVANPAPQTGAGCITSGQTLPVDMLVWGADSGGVFHFGGYIERLPANAAVTLMLGSQNPNQQVPGLCGSLYTNLLAAVGLGNADATGFFGTTRTGLAGIAKYPGGPFVFVLPNTFGGGTFYLQAHAVDPGSTQPIQVVNSAGRSITVPMPNLTKINKVTCMYNHDGGTTAPWAIYNQFGFVGAAIVTQLTY